MKKTNRNIERVKFIKGIIKAQIPVMLVIVFLLFTSMPFDSWSAAKKTEIKVDNVGIYNTFFSASWGVSRPLIITSNSVDYEVVSVAIDSRLLREEILTKISVGDIIDITYVEDQHPFWKENRIYGLITKDGEIISAEEQLNIRQQSVTWVFITCCVIELIYLVIAFVIYYLAFLKQDIRKWKYRQKKLRDKAKAEKKSSNVDS